MLSQTTEYALRIVVQLASQRDRMVTIPALGTQATRARPIDPVGVR